MDISYMDISLIFNINFNTCTVYTVLGYFQLCMCVIELIVCLVRFD